MVALWHGFRRHHFKDHVAILRARRRVHRNILRQYYASVTKQYNLVSGKGR